MTWAHMLTHHLWLFQGAPGLQAEHRGKPWFEGIRLTTVLWMIVEDNVQGERDERHACIKVSNCYTGYFHSNCSTNKMVSEVYQIGRTFVIFLTTDTVEGTISSLGMGGEEEEEDAVLELGSGVKRILVWHINRFIIFIWIRTGNSSHPAWWQSTLPLIAWSLKISLIISTCSAPTYMQLKSLLNSCLSVTNQGSCLPLKNWKLLTWYSNPWFKWIFAELSFLNSPNSLNPNLTTLTGLACQTRRLFVAQSSPLRTHANVCKGRLNKLKRLAALKAQIRVVDACFLVSN